MILGRNKSTNLFDNSVSKSPQINSNISLSVSTPRNLNIINNGISRPSYSLIKAFCCPSLTVIQPECSS